MLRRALDCCTIQSCWWSHPRLLLWTVVLGDIAVSSTSHRPWYASRLHKLSAKLEIYDWELIKKILSLFLWWDDICDEPAKKLWQESDHQRYRMTTALKSCRRNEESGISSTNFGTTELNVTDVEDKPCQLA